MIELFNDLESELSVAKEELWCAQQKWAKAQNEADTL